MGEKNRLPLLDTAVDFNVGLSKAQIDDRKAKGYVNDVKIGTSKPIWKIFVSNIFTFFNLLCFAIFVWMISIVKDFTEAKNLTFMVIIFCNTAIGIIQEIRAKKTMDKLSFLSSPNITVVRSAEQTQVKLNELVLDDIALLQTGNQVCSDCEIIEGEVEVNESMLTGESLPIKKFKGDLLLSGSFIVSGKCTARVSGVGADNYIQRLALEAKKFKKPKSELVKSLNLIMKIIAFVIIPLGILAFLSNFNSELNKIIFQSDKMYGALSHLGEYTKMQISDAYRNAVIPTSASMIGMIPTGMFLLTSVALAVGIMRLAKNKALVQELYSIETLARVDMLCLDKTGTITDGTMSVKDILLLSKTLTEDELKKLLSSMQYALDETNQTAKALQDKFGNTEIYKADKFLPFASERKCSAVQFGEKTYVIGAPEYVNPVLKKSAQEKLDEYTKYGYRCLLLAVSDNAIEDDKIPSKPEPIAMIIIEDNIKMDVIPVIKYFRENEVDVRVISGDNPLTVSVIAQKVGILNADKYLSLKDMSDDEIIAVAKNYTVFGRVSPSQKKLLIKLFKSQGHTVAMTGDGINDILAMKEADCSIAMANGSEATRNMAQLVLLDSNFSSMPKIVSEGRRVVNNIERSSVLFLTKTVFSAILTLMLVFMNSPFPIDPIQLSFVSLFAIGFPSFVLALEPNDSPIHGRFITNVLKGTLPGAVAVTVCVYLIMLLDGADQFAISREGLKTMVMLAIFINYLLIISWICKPFNKTRLRMMFTVIVVATMCVITFPLFANQDFNIFNIAPINNLTLVAFLLALVFVSEKLMKLGNYLIAKYWVNDNDLFSKISALAGKIQPQKKSKVSVASLDKKEEDLKKLEVGKVEDKQENSENE